MRLDQQDQPRDQSTIHQTTPAADETDKKGRRIWQREQFENYLRTENMLDICKDKWPNWETDWPTVAMAFGDDMDPNDVPWK